MNFDAPEEDLPPAVPPRERDANGDYRPSRALTPEQQGQDTPKGFKPTMDRPVPNKRCTGITKNGERAGQQCNKWAVLGAPVCMVHGAQLPSVRKAAEERLAEYRMRILEDGDKAISTLFSLLDSPENNVRLGAAKELVNIIGVKEKADITVEVQHGLSPALVLQEKMDQMRQRAKADDEQEIEIILDGEEVSDEDEQPMLPLEPGSPWAN